MYTVPENDTSGVPLCVEIDKEITEPQTYTIRAVQKSPPEAEGTPMNNSCVVHSHNSQLYSVFWLI